jgi:hypothetical protein
VRTPRKTLGKQRGWLLSVLSWRFACGHECVEGVDNLQELVLSFLSVGSRNKQVIRVGGKHLCTPSQLASSCSVFLVSGTRQAEACWLWLVSCPSSSWHTQMWQGAFALTGQIWCCSSYLLTPNSGTLKVSGTVPSSQGCHLDVHTPVCQLHRANHFHPLLLFVSVLAHEPAVGVLRVFLLWQSHSGSGNICTKNVVSSVSKTRNTSRAGLPLEMPLILCIILPSPCWSNPTCNTQTSDLSSLRLPSKVLNIKQKESLPLHSSDRPSPIAVTKPSPVPYPSLSAVEPQITSSSFRNVEAQHILFFIQSDSFWGIWSSGISIEPDYRALTSLTALSGSRQGTCRSMNRKIQVSYSELLCPFTNKVSASL